MSRLSLAFVCFFRVLFGKQLPPDAARLLLAAAPPVAPPAAAQGTPAPAPARDLGPVRPQPERPRPEPERPRPEPERPRPEPERPRPEPERPRPEPERPRPEPERPRPSAAIQHRDGALALLALLQREGRLVDFLREPLDGFSDADIGAAARDVHRGCKQVLDQHLTLEPVMPGSEEARVEVPKGFDPAEIRLIGEARGEPPFRGTLRHHGWRVVEAKLPALADAIDRMVIAPAEVEL
jgi:hypothetical protein